MATGGNVRAAILSMLAAMAMFTFADTIGKWFVANFPIGEMLGLRSVAVLIVLAIILIRQRGSLKLSLSERPVIQAVRIVFVLSETGCFFWAVRYLPLADTLMFYLASPLFLTIFSAVILKETVGIIRWGAVVIGLIGVFFIFPPSEAAISIPGLVALTGSISMAMMLTLTRMLRNSAGLDLLVLQTVAVAIAGFATMPFIYVSPSFSDFGLLCLMGFMAAAGHFLMNKSVSLAQSAVVAPFQYTSIIWGIGLGYVIWGDFPTARSLIGVAIIISAGLLVLYREWRLGVKRKRTARTTP